MLQNPSCQQAGILPVSCEQKSPHGEYQPLADAMLEILSEDECNDTYGRIRMSSGIDIEAAGKRGDPQ